MPRGRTTQSEFLSVCLTANDWPYFEALALLGVKCRFHLCQGRSKNDLLRVFNKDKFQPRTFRIDVRRRKGTQIPSNECPPGDFAIDYGFPFSLRYQIAIGNCEISAVKWDLRLEQPGEYGGGVSLMYGGCVDVWSDFGNVKHVTYWCMRFSDRNLWRRWNRIP